MNKEEKKDQKKLIAWAITQIYEYPCLRWLHHISNGELRDAKVSRELAAMGVRSGVFDLFLPVASGEYSGWYWDMKTDTGSLTKDQRDFENFAETQGFCVGYGDFEAAKCSLAEYLRGVKNYDDGRTI